MAEFDFLWEKEAAHGEPMPDGLSLAEQCAFQALSNLYARYKAGLISRESGTAEKGKIKYSFRRWAAAEKCASESAFRYANLLREIECTHNRYRRERTLENANLLSAVLDGKLHT